MISSHPNSFFSRQIRHYFAIVKDTLG